MAEVEINQKNQDILINGFIAVVDERMAALLLLPLLLLLLLLPPSPAAHACPCSDQSLCGPLDPAKAKVQEGPATGVEAGGWEVFAFTRSTGNWSAFDWDITTTVAMDGHVDMQVPSPSMICLAHGHGARVVLMSGETTNFTNATARSALVASLVAKTVASGCDGINLDIEQYQRSRDALSLYVKELSEALRRAIPGAQLSFDVGILPNGQSSYYDHRGLANHVDFLVPMAYDENWGSVTPKANCPLSGLTLGLQQYHALGVRMESIVVALPWYSTSWPCKDSTRGAPCVADLGNRKWADVVSSPRQSSSVSRIGTQNISAVALDQKDMVKMVEWVENRTAPNSPRHVDWFEDGSTLAFKVKHMRAQVAGMGGGQSGSSRGSGSGSSSSKLGGVGTFCADYIDGDSIDEVRAMWAALS